MVMAGFGQAGTARLLPRLVLSFGVAPGTLLEVPHDSDGENDGNGKHEDLVPASLMGHDGNERPTRETSCFRHAGQATGPSAVVSRASVDPGAAVLSVFVR